MALVNGDTYYGFTEDELTALTQDGDYADIVSLFQSSGFSVTIGGTNYVFVPSGTLDAMDLIGRFDEDLTPPDVTLDSAVYYSAFGFTLL